MVIRHGRMERDAAAFHITLPGRRDGIHERLLNLVTANQAFNSTMRVVCVRNTGGMWQGPYTLHSKAGDPLDVAVIGKPDPLRGQLVKACVVLRPGVAALDDLKTELQVHCKRLIAAYKYPREIEFVRELPKTTSGKTRHVALREAAMTG